MPTFLICRGAWSAAWAWGKSGHCCAAGHDEWALTDTEWAIAPMPAALRGEIA